MRIHNLHSEETMVSKIFSISPPCVWWVWELFHSRWSYCRNKTVAWKPRMIMLPPVSFKIHCRYTDIICCTMPNLLSVSVAISSLLNWKHCFVRLSLIKRKQAYLVGKHITGMMLRKLNIEWRIRVLRNSEL